MSTSKSCFLSELTTTSLSLYSTSNALKAEIFPAMKCVTFHYSQRSMNKLLDLLAMIFQDFQITGNITLGCTKLAYIINYGFKKYFREEYMGLVKNINDFTMCIDKFLNHILIASKYIHIYYFMMVLLITLVWHILGYHLWDMVMLKPFWRNWKKP